MVAQPQAHDFPQTIIIPSHVIVALEQLDRGEQASVRSALKSLEQQQTSICDFSLKRLNSLDELYILRAAPQVRVILRMVPNAPIEVLDIVRPETLQNLRQAQ